MDRQPLDTHPHMNISKQKNAVLLLAYKRPRHTSLVLQQIANYFPEDLFIFIDGLSSEASETDKAAHEKVTELARNFGGCSNLNICVSEKNCGSGMAMPTALTWAFEQTESLIILEDDILPSQSFFEFSSNALDYFAPLQNVKMISGNKYDFLPQNNLPILTKFSFTYGWATWRNRWEQYDFDLKTMSQTELNEILTQNLFTLDCIQRDWVSAIDKIKSGGKLSFWDYQWQFYLWSSNGLSVQPPRNLAENIGFGEGATHTFEEDWRSMFRAQNINIDCASRAIHSRAWREFIICLYKTNIPRNIFKYTSKLKPL